MIVTTDNPVELAKEIFWLAWNACGGPRGMGFLQDRANVSRDDVWSNVNCSGDYPINHYEPSRPYADYVFGRMMKFGMTVHGDRLEIPDEELRRDYQSWCGTYPTVSELVSAATKSMDELRQESQSK